MDSKPALKTGDRLPPLLLPAAGVGQAVALREEGRLATVLLTLHGGCAPCEEYLATLTRRATEIVEWDGRIVAAIVGGGTPIPDSGEGVVRITIDADERLRASGAGTPVVLIADQWGELFMVEGAGTTHDFPDPAEIIAWLRYLAIQCPECQGEAM